MSDVRKADGDEGAEDACDGDTDEDQEEEEESFRDRRRYEALTQGVLRELKRESPNHEFVDREKLFKRYECIDTPEHESCGGVCVCGKTGLKYVYNASYIPINYLTFPLCRYLNIMQARGNPNAPAVRTKYAITL